MAKKRRASPLDDPPTASSSDEEEEEAPKPSQQQPKEDEADEEGQSSSDDSGEEDESEEEDEENQPSVLSQSSAKNPPPPPPTKSQPKPSSSESESGTDSDSDEEDDDQAPNSKVKPLASKPMDQNPNYKTKAQTKTPSSPPPNKSGTKRATENNKAHANDSKRAKKKGTDTAVPAASAAGSDDEMETEDVKKSGEDSKKLFQRVWSEEDEITIVKSMLDFISKSGNDPVKYIAVFYDFVKKSLSFEATSTQLKHKIRRIKVKYNVAAQKARKNGVDPNFSKPRDQKLYDLSKKVWGKDSNEVEEKGKSNGRTPKSPKKEASAKNTTSARKPARTKKVVPEASEETELPEQVVALKETVKGESDKEVALSEMFGHDKGNSIPGLNEAVVHRGLDFMDESKKAAMAAKWKEYRADEFKMFMRRSDLVREQAALVWEAYQASNP